MTEINANITADRRSHGSFTHSQIRSALHMMSCQKWHDADCRVPVVALRTLMLDRDDLFRETVNLRDVVTSLVGAIDLIHEAVEGRYVEALHERINDALDAARKAQQ